MQLEDVNIVALDLGGSLSKVVYFSRKPMGENGDDNVGGRLHFERFATKPIDECVDFVEKIVNECRSGGHEVVRFFSFLVVILILNFCNGNR